MSRPQQVYGRKHVILGLGRHRGGGPVQSREKQSGGGTLDLAKASRSALSCPRDPGPCNECWMCTVPHRDAMDDEMTCLRASVRHRPAFLGSVGCEMFEYITRRTSEGKVLGLFATAFASKQGRSFVHSFSVALLVP